MNKIRIVYFLGIIYTLVFMPFAVQASEVRDIIFPVEEGWDYNFSDTYGAARSGGRSHIGTDIMTDQMTPLVAAVDGRVSYLVDQDKGWGLAIYIEDNKGYSYRYLHVNNDTPGTDDGKGIRAYAFPKNIKRGVMVKAGQVIAFAGDSGNAEWTGHHLHFEIWTPNKQATNAYPSLMAALNKPVEINTEESSEILTSIYKFDKNLELGDENFDVKELQKYLNKNGFIVASSGAGSIGNETNYFGPATQRALISFQKAKGISPAAGYFGPVTRATINKNTVSASIGQTISNVVNNEILEAGWLVKDNILPKVFYVADNLELQWIVSEEVAIREFGKDWHLDIKYFDDLEGAGLSFGDHVF
jgi:murein DD-endopeptidase MepM/ murein hydrolase activator NlpD